MEEEVKTIIDNRENLTPDNSTAFPNDLVDKYLPLFQGEALTAVMDLIKQSYNAGLELGRNESPLFMIIPMSIAENKDLSANAKLLYGEILALSKKSGKCYATNEHLGDMLGLERASIPKLLSELSGIGLIIVDIKRSEKGTYRNIMVSFFNNGGYGSLVMGGMAKQRGQKRNRQIEIDKKLPKGRKNTSEYGNPEINKILNTLKEKFSLTKLDGSDKVNRQYANLAIKKFGADLPAIIEAAAGDDFWRNKVSSVKDIYYNGVKILQLKKGGIRAIDLSAMMN